MVTYEPGFKEQAVKIAGEVGAPKTAQDLGIPINTLYIWLRNAKNHGEKAYVGSGHKRNDNANDEVAKLLKRNKEWERANDVLREALSFFVVMSGCLGDQPKRSKQA